MSFDKDLCYILIYEHFSNNLCRFQRKSTRKRLLTRRLCCKAWERKQLKNPAAGKAVWSREDLFLSREVKPLCMQLWPISGRSIVNNLCLLMVTSSGRWKVLEQRLGNVLEPGNESQGHRKKKKNDLFFVYKQVNNLLSLTRKLGIWKVIGVYKGWVNFVCFYPHSVLLNRN